MRSARLLCSRNSCKFYPSCDYGYTGFDYLKSGRSHIGPNLGTQIWPNQAPDPDLGRTCIWITDITPGETVASTMLSAAILRRQYSSVIFCCITVFQFLTKFLERKGILYFFVRQTLIKTRNTPLDRSAVLVLPVINSTY